MNIVLLVGLALVAVFYVPWLRAIRGTSAPSEFGCLAQLLFWLGIAITVAGVAMVVAQTVDEAISPEQRKALSVAVTRQIFHGVEPEFQPKPIEILEEYANILSQWNLLLILGGYGLVFLLIFGFVARMSLDDRQLSHIMTGLSYLAITLLVLTTNFLLLGTGGLTDNLSAIDSQSASSLVILVRLFWLVVIGLLARLVAMPMSGWSPSFASFVQASSQLWVLAGISANGELVRSPGIVFALVLVVGAKVFITATEAVIKRMIPARAVLATIALSGFLVIAPIAMYGAWIRLVNQL